MGNLNLNNQHFILAMCGVVAVILAVILLYDLLYLRKKSKSDLASLHANSGQKSPLIGRAKYPELDVFKHSGSFLGLGLASALALAIITFAYTKYEKEVIIPDDALVMEEEIEQAPPRTAEPPPPPPPPPPPVIEEVPEEELEEEEIMEFQDRSVEEETIVEAPIIEKKAPPPPPPPPPKKEAKVDEIFQVVEDAPRFPGCENLATKDEKAACATKKMLDFIYKNIKYPAIARENGVEGGAVVTFVVEKDGSITDVKVLRDPGAGTGDEALRVVEMMNSMPQKWIPGKQRGKPVRVQFNLPVKFKLNN